MRAPDTTNSPVIAEAADQPHGEVGIIQGFLAPLAAGFPGAFGLADDCAAFTPAPGQEIIVKCDPIRAGVHFFADDAAQDIGWKALAVNVSDLAAKAARPLAYTMALSFPEAPRTAWLAAFSEGLAEAQEAFGITLIGGDTDRAPGPISIVVTVFGETPSGRMVTRAGARPGDVLIVTGTLGDAAAGLALRRTPDLAAAWGLTDAAASALRRRYLRPEPRLALKAALRNHARAAMDLSDGLVKDLGRMVAASGVGAGVRADDVPVSAALRLALSAAPELRQAAFSHGDDYEILAAVAPERVGAFKQTAAAAGVATTAIGLITAEAGVTVTASDGRPIPFARPGYDHF